MNKRQVLTGIGIPKSKLKAKKYSHKPKISGVLKYRKFDGKIFRLEDILTNKHDALKLAEKRRNLGENARILKEIAEVLMPTNKWQKRNVYAVYTGYSKLRKKK